MLGHKVSLGKYKKIGKSSQHVFWLQCYEIRNQQQGKIVKKKQAKTHKHWDAKKYVTQNNQWITEEIKDKNQELTRDKWKLKYDDQNPTGLQQQQQF